jgi:DNA-binding transcriptional ArsR family regulator
MNYETISQRGCRGGSVYLTHFRPLNRGQRGKILRLAEEMDQRTKRRGRHGGELGRPALAVLRALVTKFHNVVSGRLDPSIASIAAAANVARSTAQTALDRLERAGLIERVRRMTRVQGKIWSAALNRHVWADRVVQLTNAYRLNNPLPDRAEHGDLSRTPPSDTGKRSPTIPVFILKEKPPSGLDAALARLQQAMGQNPVKQNHGP